MHNPVKKKLARTFFSLFPFLFTSCLFVFCAWKGKGGGSFWVGFALSEGGKRGKKSEQKRALDFFRHHAFFFILVATFTGVFLLGKGVAGSRSQ